jgi:YD repeat-containing protein
MNTIGLSTLVVSEETWITKNSINYLVDAYVQDYKAISNGSIKLSKKYILKSIDPIAENLIPAFNSSSLFRDPNLFEEKVSVDNFSLAGNPSQITDNAQTSVSTIYENYGKLAVATVMNAKLTEVAFTSFEDLSPYYPLANELLGNFRLTGVPQRASTISGNQAFQGQVVTTLTTGTYRITYWCNTTGGLSLTASSIIEPQQLIRSTNGWSLYKAIVSITGVTGSITINSGSYLIDEARILPTASRISTINFNDRLLKSSSADDNNVFTYYEYDGFGRLIIVRDHERNIVSKTCYKYNGQIENCTIYFNVQKSGVFTRNNCGPGSVGGTATYVVPTGTYTSSYSQGFADQQAQDDVNLNGQAYANVYGSCTTPTCNSSNCSGDDRKCINGVCEIGTWTSISSVWKKKDGVWQWECVYKYCFSDGSFSTYSLTTYSASSCPMTCFFD